MNRVFRIGRASSGMPGFRWDPPPALQKSSSTTMRKEVNCSWEVWTVAGESLGVLQLEAATLGDLRKEIKMKFGIPSFEQHILYRSGDGQAVVESDDSVLLRERPELLDVKDIMLVRQLDPRHKMEKETAFFSALTACHYEDAMDILESSGVAVDPNCVHKHTIPQFDHTSHTESAKYYTHPALTVAIQAGLEHATGLRGMHKTFAGFDAVGGPLKMQAFMDRDKEVCEVVKLLIDKRADVNAVGDEQEDCDSGCMPTRHDKTPLCAAVQRGSPALVRLLLDARANANHTMQYDRGPILTPESWLNNISFGSVTPWRENDPRRKNQQEILDMLHAAKHSAKFDEFRREFFNTEFLKKCGE